MEIIIDNKIKLPLDFPPAILKRVRDDLNRMNPAWEEAVEAGRSTKGLIARIKLLNQENSCYTVPRGYLYKLKEYTGEEFEKFFPPQVFYFQRDELDFTFHGTLKPNQRVCEREILKNNFSVIQRPTGGGKTVIGLKVIAERKMPALIIVPTERLLKHWVERAEQFLKIPEKEIGRMGDGEFGMGEKVTVAIVNSLYNLNEEQWRQINEHIGHLVVDECHRAPANCFGEVIGKFSCPYMLGLSATVYRSDGLDDFIHYYLGEKVHEVSIKRLQELGEIMTPELKVIKTNFFFPIKDPRDYQRMVKKLIENQPRNSLIARRAIRHTEKHTGIALIASNFKKHCRALEEELIKLGVTPFVIVGEVNPKERDRIIQEMKKCKSGILIATWQLMGEGFDFPALSSLFVAAPIKFEGKVVQIVGRILRIEEGKEKTTIIDFNDPPWLLQHSLKKRLTVYVECGAEL